MYNGIIFGALGCHYYWTVQGSTIRDASLQLRKKVRQFLIFFYTQWGVAFD